MSKSKRVSLLKYGSLLGLVLLPLFSVSGMSPKECVEVASWWLPSDTTTLKTVTKWQDEELSFAVFSRDDRLPAVGFVEAGLKFVSQHTGLKMTKMDPSDRSSLPDLLIAVDPNVVEHSAKLKRLAEKFFEKKLKGTIHINDEQWETNVRSMSPKCFPFNIEVNDKKNVAILMVEEGETAACVDIALSEEFGILSARTLYKRNDAAVSANALGVALSQLYAKTIRSGMSASEALKQVRDECSK